jgi:hypothetical protein
MSSIDDALVRTERGWEAGGEEEGSDAASLRDVCQSWNAAAY